MKNFTLTWNSAEKNWDAEEDRTDDKIVFIYPTKGSSSNNATLTIHNIETEEFIFEDSCWYEMEWVNGLVKIAQTQSINQIKSN